MVFELVEVLPEGSVGAVVASGHQQVEQVGAIRAGRMSLVRRSQAIQAFGEAALVRRRVSDLGLVQLSQRVGCAGFIGGDLRAQETAQIAERKHQKEESQDEQYKATTRPPAVAARESGSTRLEAIRRVDVFLPGLIDDAETDSGSLFIGQYLVGR